MNRTIKTVSAILLMMMTMATVVSCGGGETEKVENHDQDHGDHDHDDHDHDHDGHDH